MVYLVYGSDLIQSRNFIGFIKSKFPSSQTKTIYAKKDFNFRNLEDLIPTTSLFSESVLVNIEFEKSPNVRETKCLTFLENLGDAVNVILWVGENLNKVDPLLKHAQTRKNFTIKAFNKKDATLNFELTDTINSKDSRALTILNKILIKDSDASLILTILASNFRNILGIKLDCAFAKNLHPYVKLKMDKASKRFSELETINILKKIYETDLKIKSSTCDVKSALFSLICYTLSPDIHG